jgi:exodeoxyribonuclease VII small subunit
MSDKKTLDYVSVSQQLEEIVSKLQDESTSIEESLKLYERGITLTKELKVYLAQAENKLKKISASAGDK